MRSEKRATLGNKSNEPATNAAGSSAAMRYFGRRLPEEKALLWDRAQHTAPAGLASDGSMIELRVESQK